MINHSAIFAQHFARLVALASQGSAAPEELDYVARAAEAMLRSGPATLGVKDWHLLVNDAPIPSALSGVPDLSLAARFVGHGIQQLKFASFSPRDEIISTANAIAAEPEVGDRGRSIQAAFNRLSMQKVKIEVTGTLSPDVPPDIIGGDVASLQEKFGGQRHTPIAEEMYVTRGLDSSTTSAAAIVVGSDATSIGAAIDEASGSGKLARVIDDLIRDAETAGIKGGAHNAKVFEIAHAIVSRETSPNAGNARTTFVIGVKRLAKRAILMALVRHVASNRDLEQQILTIFERVGEDGATLLVEELAESQQRSERRALVDILGKLKMGQSSLQHSLSDPRWYVVRNAADLLGVMQAAGATQDLLQLFNYSDERVRRAAVGAVAQLASQPGTIEPLMIALEDSDEQVRAAAATGLGLRRSAKSLEALVGRLEKEDDERVQNALLDALGKNGTPSAVNRLVEAAEPSGRLFKRKTVSYRVAAATALRSVDSPIARAALEKLRQDKEAQVRAAAGS